MIYRWQPKQTKFKRLQKGGIKKCRFKPTSRTTQFGLYALKILKSTRLTAKQLEQVRRKILSVRKKKEKQLLWSKCQSDIPVTTKPLGIRMGKGKGTVEFWIAKAIAGKLIFHLTLKSKHRIKKALKRAQKILPIPTKVYINRNMIKKKFKFKIIKNKRRRKKRLFLTYNYINTDAIL